MLYGGMAAMGFTMFGEDTASQITLNLPGQFVASKIAVWTTVQHNNPSTFFHFHFIHTLPSACVNHSLKNVCMQCGRPL
jgi:hypothetical protein